MGMGGISSSTPVFGVKQMHSVSAPKDGEVIGSS